jgi:hypothetical protein
MTRTIISLLLASSLGMPLAQADTTWDLTADYKTTANANGAWSYGWEQTLNAALNLYDASQGTQWYSSTHHSGDFTPTIWMNDSSGRLYGVAPGEVAMHPGWDNSFSVSRWISPIAGTVTVSGYFGAGDGGSMSYYIADNGSTLQQWTSEPSTKNFSFTTTVSAGETLDFIVGVPIGGGYGYGTTPIAVTITAAVPEPESYAMLLAGLGLMAAVARQRKMGN